MSQEENKAPQIVGYEWADDAKVVLTGKQFRTVLNFLNQYPQIFAKVMEQFFNETQKMFVEVAENLDEVVQDMYTSGQAIGISEEEFQKRLEEKMSELNPTSTEEPSTPAE